MWKKNTNNWTEMRHLSLRHHFILRNTSVAGPAVAAAVSWVPPCGCTTAIFMSSIHSPLSPQPPSCPQFYFPQKHQAGFLRIFLFIEALPKSTAQGLLLSSWAVLWPRGYLNIWTFKVCQRAANVFPHLSAIQLCFFISTNWMFFQCGLDTSFLYVKRRGDGLMKLMKSHMKIL